MADIEKVENWRLSRIEDELEKLDFTQDFLDNSLSDSIFNSLPSEIGHSLKLTAAKTEDGQKDDEGYSEENEEELPPPPQELLYPEEDPVGQSELTDPGPELSQLTRVCVQDRETESGIYSEANVKPVIIKTPAEADAVKKITDKYDSLKRLTLPSLPKFIPPGYVKAKPTSVTVDSSSTSGVSVQKVVTTPTKMSDPFLNCLPTSSPHIQQFQQQVSASDPPPPPSPVTHNTSWSDMQEATSQMIAAASQDHPQGLSNHSSIKRLSFVSSLTENEILQVEMFYRSHKTEVFVCSCTAELFFGSAVNASNNLPPSNNVRQEPNSGWTLVMSGVPVVILENEDRHGNKRLSLVMAEKGTGFCLWKENFTHLTDYQVKQQNFHTLHLDADHTKLAGLRFQESSGASHFLQRLQMILNNPEISITNVNAKSKKAKNPGKNSGNSKNGKLKRRPTSKGDISAPCCFTHITSLDRSEGMGVIEMTGSNGENSASNVSVVHSRQKVK